jgi:hypothetical protein
MGNSVAGAVVVQPTIDGITRPRHDQPMRCEIQGEISDVENFAAAIGRKN